MYMNERLVPLIRPISKRITLATKFKMKEASDVELIRTIEPQRAFLHEAYADESGNLDESTITKFTKIPKVQIGQAAIDVQNYWVMIGFREPSIHLRGYLFDKKHPEAQCISQNFPKDFSGLFFLGSAFEGRQKVVAVGT